MTRIVDFIRENPRQTRNYNELSTIYLKLHKTLYIALKILIFLWSFDFSSTPGMSLARFCGCCIR